MKALHHVGITVKDLDASIRFYHDVLGAATPALARTAGAALRQVSLLLGDTTLELLEYRNPPSKTTSPLGSNNVGASHVAFLVDDVDAKKAELEAKGIEFNSRVNVVDEGVLGGWRWVYFSDPDGYPLELVQVAYYNAEERRAGIAAYLTSRS